MSEQVQTKRDLSPQQLQYINGLREMCKPKTTDFPENIKMNDGDVRTFLFDPDPEKIRPVEFESKWGEDGDKKQLKIVFTVEDPDSGEQGALWLAKTHADLVLQYVQQGIRLLSIERIGSKVGTNYRVKPAG